VLRRIFGRKGDEIIGKWRRLHNEELHALCSSNTARVIKSRRLGLAWHVECVGEKYIQGFLVGKPEARRPIGRPRRRWEGNNKIDHGEVGWGAWIGSIWLRIGTGSGLLLIRQ
jgi:hypothetical protein